MYDVSNAQYRDAGCPSQCSSMYEYATVSEMNGVQGAVPIPPSTASRLYQPAGNVLANSPVQPTSSSSSAPSAVPTMPSYIRYN